MPALVVPITVGGCLLALYWSFLVPIFQAPDEPAHFDYAMTVYSHGLVNLRDRPEYVYFGFYGFAHPYTRYLVQRTGLLDVDYHPEVRMAPGYGTSAYYADLDRTAPKVPSPFTPPLNPFLVSVYPFGFYLLLAGWLHLLAPAGLGVTGLFFAARALSVLLLAGTLPLTYRVSREVGLRPRLAVTMTAVIAFFPLTSFVASSVQPDNLSWLLVTLAVYLALRGRRAGFALPWLAGLGLVLGLLLATKLHFYASVLPVVAAMVIAERLYLRERWRGPNLFPTGWAVLLLPSLVSGAVSAWVMVWPGFPFGGAPSQRAGALQISTTAFFAALHRGPVDFLIYVIGDLQGAFYNFYAGGGLVYTANGALGTNVGSTVQSFWAIFGWRDTPLIIHSSRITDVVHDVVVAGTVVLFVLMLLRLQSTTTRLLRLARRGRPRTALRLAFGDPFMNAYLLFTVLMFGIYVVTDGTFLPQGRNWIPFLLPAFLVGVVHAPRVFAGARFKRVASALTLVTLLGFSSIGAIYALRDLQHRYYGAGAHVSAPVTSSLPKLGDGLVYSVDSVTAVGWPNIPAESYVSIEGWSFDKAGGGSPSALVASLDGRVDFPGVTGLSRPDVAQARGDQAYADSGFLIALSASGFEPGVHQLTLRFVAADGHGYYEIPPMEFWVAP